MVLSMETPEKYGALREKLVKREETPEKGEEPESPERSVEPKKRLGYMTQSSN